MTYLREEADGHALSLSIHVQPKSSRACITGLHGEAIKLCLNSPPVDGKANREVIQFLAKFFKIPKAAVTIASGETSRNKRLILTGISLVQAETMLQPLLAPKTFAKTPAD